MSNVIRLGDYITEISEKTTVNNQHMVLTSSQEGIVSQDDYFNKQVASKDNTGYKIIRRGQFTYRAMSDTGRFYINRLTDYDIGIVSPAYPVFELRTNGQILPEYLQEYFHSEHFQNAITLSSTGSTRVSLKLAKIADLRIDIPTLPKQQCAVQAISHVNHLIFMQNSSAAKLDQLVKSRFVEMFIGKNYSRKTVDEVSLGKGEYGAQSASAVYTPDRPRYVRITDINDDGTLNNDVVSSINHSDDDQYRLRYGDFLFARMGATVGKTYAFREGNQIYAGYLIRYKLDLTQIHPLYLFWYTRLNEYWDWVKLNQSGAAQPGINAKKFGSLRIPVPPIDIQNRFVAFVAEVDKSKLAVKQSLEKLETLKKSLMQEYFG